MRILTDEQIKAMVGTEFIYSDRGTEIPAVIAAFDPSVGFTCLATSLTDNRGNKYQDRTDENGNFCLIGLGSGQHKKDFYEDISFTIRSIKCLGYYVLNSEYGFRNKDVRSDAHCQF